MVDLKGGLIFSINFLKRRFFIRLRVKERRFGVGIFGMVVKRYVIFELIIKKR